MHQKSPPRRLPARRHGRNPRHPPPPPLLHHHPSPPPADVAGQSSPAAGGGGICFPRARAPTNPRRRPKLPHSCRPDLDPARSVRRPGSLRAGDGHPAREGVPRGSLPPPPPEISPNPNRHQKSAPNPRDLGHARLLRRRRAFGLELRCPSRGLLPRLAWMSPGWRGWLAYKCSPSVPWPRACLGLDGVTPPRESLLLPLGGLCWSWLAAAPRPRHGGAPAGCGAPSPLHRRDELEVCLWRNPCSNPVSEQTTAALSCAVHPAGGVVREIHLQPVAAVPGESSATTAPMGVVPLPEGVAMEPRAARQVLKNLGS